MVAKQNFRIFVVAILKLQDMRTFFLRTKNVAGYATLYTRIRKRNPNVDIFVNSLIQVDIIAWEKANSDLDAWNKFLKTKDGKEIYSKMQDVDEAICNLTEQRIYEKSLIDEAIANVIYKEVREEQRKREEEERKLQEEQERIKMAKEEARKANVLLFLQNYLNGIRDGSIKFKGESYEKNTCKVWSNFYGILKRFYAIYPFTWSNVNKELADRFLCFMENEGYMVKSINKYLICFRAMVGYALEKGLHENTLALKAFSKKKVQESDKAKEIYLTGAELQALYDMELEGLKETVRDVFLVGCYTCQRFSDYSRLERENFTTTAKGTKIVRIVQEKTGNSVVIPILNDNLLHIAEKYDYEIPQVNDVVLNRYIKQILKDLSDTVPSLARLERTVLTMKERAKEERGEVVFIRDPKGYVVKPRYDLVSSHTARRSGITNLYLTGLFDSFQMMSVSGHKDEKTFNEYIKLSSDEIADAIARKMEERRKNESSNERLF